MGDVEEPRFNSLADRIAALNTQKNFSSSPSPTSIPTPGTRKPPPPPPPTPAACSKPQPPALPSRLSSTLKPSPPPLPQRTPSFTPSIVSDTSVSTTSSAPPRKILPPPRPSLSSRPSQITPANRRTSMSSDRSLASQASVATSTDSTSARKLPPAFDPRALPALPPTRRELEVKVEEEAAARQLPLLLSKQKVPSGQQPPSLPSRPSLPPRRPTVPVEAVAPTPAPTLPSRRLPPPASEVPSMLPSQPSILQSTPSAPPRLPSRSSVSSLSKTAAAPDTPPPIPLASRPTAEVLDAILSSHPTCLTCRDFSAPDHVASQYPRDSLPAHDPIGHLARVLCGPFSSATDKARVIFTWHHHNIAYDWTGLQSGNIKGQGPDDVIRHGAAVCAGYAHTFEAIAKRAGLRCIVVTGHGKGIGYSDPQPGIVPLKNVTGHAWNAVEIDGGYWKLIDVCWGAGNCSNNRYNKAFAPWEFEMSNEEFGRRHFPQDQSLMFRGDDRVVSWAEYILGAAGGPAVTITGKLQEMRFAVGSIEPPGRDIAISAQQPIRIQLSRSCHHKVTKGLRREEQMCVFVRVAGNLVPLESDGFWWWIDVWPQDLGGLGETVMVSVAKSFNGRDIGAEGLTVGEFEEGFRSISFEGLAIWQLV